MTEADELYSRISKVLLDIEEIQKMYGVLENKINTLRGEVLLLSITSNNMHTQSASRIISSVGHENRLDMESLGQIASELIYYRNKL